MCRVNALCEPHLYLKEQSQAIAVIIAVVVILVIISVTAIVLAIAVIVIIVAIVVIATSAVIVVIVASTVTVIGTVVSATVATVAPIVVITIVIRPISIAHSCHYCYRSHSGNTHHHFNDQTNDTGNARPHKKWSGYETGSLKISWVPTGPEQKKHVWGIQLMKQISLK